MKILGPGDDPILANVAAGVFDNPINAAWTKEFLEDSRHHIAVAIDAGLVVGFASAVRYIHPDKPPELWINEVAVSPTYRGLGLAKATMGALFELGKAHDCVTAWVLTNRNNAEAMALYSSLGGIEGGAGIGDAVVGYSFDLQHIADAHPSHPPSTPPPG
ncbi:MAG: GNAT family N-acetyltransferase [Hyphomicrobiales bacterium]|nr:GNAT family N-acetyltransferase [Hyphomicrobiales bacterium]MBV9429656.1 GNAT family N-acetyltransferase [Bradyrhizobiaceae bacterium]